MNKWWNEINLIVLLHQQPASLQMPSQSVPSGGVMLWLICSHFKYLICNNKAKQNKLSKLYWLTPLFIDQMDFVSICLLQCKRNFKRNLVCRCSAVYGNCCCLNVVVPLLRWQCWSHFQPLMIAESINQNL